MKKLVVTSAVILLFLARTVLAQVGIKVEINEIMYNLKTGSDSGREWVEVYNNSQSFVDLQKLSFFEGNVNHKIKLVDGDASLAPQGYAIIASNPAKFKIDWPNFSGNIFDSSFSLSNSGEVLAIKSGDAVIDQYTYNSGEGADGNGDSLQKIGGVWQGSYPTPGEENKITKKVQLVTADLAINPSKISTKQDFNDQDIPGGETAVSPKNESKTASYPYFFVTTLILLIAGATLTGYLIFRKKSDSKVGEDFEILD